MQIYRPINALLEDIRKATANLDVLRGCDNKVTTDHEHKKIIEEMNTLNRICMSQANSVKGALVQIKQMNDDFDKEDDNHINSTHIQIRTNLYQSTCRRFQEHMAAFTQSREAFRQHIHVRMIRQVKIVDPMCSEQDARNLIEKEGFAEQLLSQVLASENLLGVLAELRARNQELFDLQRNIEGLYEMFKDLYNIIEINGETLNIIEQRVARSLDYAQRTEDQIKQATVEQKKAGKLKCIILMILLVVMIVVLAPVLIKTTSKANHNTKIG